MSSSTTSATSPGNEANGAPVGEIHHLVFPPRTPPLGQENDEFSIESAVTALTLGERHSLDLILRVSDPNQVHRTPDVDFWLIVRVYPERASFRVIGDKLVFNGTAFKLVAGEEDGVGMMCTASITVIDNLPASVSIGEVTLTYGGTQ